MIIGRGGECAVPESKATDTALVSLGFVFPPLPGTAMRGDKWKLPGDTLW